MAASAEPLLHGHASEGSVLDRMLYRVLAIYGCVALVTLALVPARFLPAEDAVILFQYSSNLAKHGAITYLANGPHIEGATDFAWMVLIAAGIKIGVPPFWIAAVANVLCVILLALLLLKIAERRVTPLRLAALAGAMALAPQICAAAAGFAVLPDAVLLTSLVYGLLRSRVAWAALSALLLCLFSPDGVLFALPCLAALVLRDGQPRRVLGIVSLLFVLPGALYFLWRWHYFGELLPLPFLVKSDAERTLGLFNLASVRQSLVYLGLTAALLTPVWLSRRARHLWLLPLLLVAPTLFYWSLRLDQNVAARFYYYLLLCAAIAIANNWTVLREYQSVIFRVGWGAWLVLLVLPLYREVRSFRDYQFNNVKRIAEAMGALPLHGVLLTTEAGFLPYFSGWYTYDASGLNTPWFAHRFLQSGDVAALGADLIVLHPDRSESCMREPSWAEGYTTRTWPHLTRNLVLGTNPDAYDLWLIAYGSEFYRRRKHWQWGEGDRECWFVRKGTPFSVEMAQILRTHEGVPPERAVAMEQAR